MTDHQRPTNPLDPTQSLHPPTETNKDLQAQHPQAAPDLEDSAVTKAEKYERHGEQPAKRLKLEAQDGRVKGVAPIKAEYLVKAKQQSAGDGVETEQPAANGNQGKHDDDAAEAARDTGDGRAKKKNKGQNTHRTFGSSRDEVSLCQSRANYPELSPAECPFGAKCKFEHDLRKYLREGKRDDLTTFGGVCPVWEAHGKCNDGWRCRFVGSHSREVDNGGERELELVERQTTEPAHQHTTNLVSTETKVKLMKRKFATPKADKYLEWMNKTDQLAQEQQDEADNRAMYTEPPFLPSEKRKIYFGRDTPVLAPLTTQGNLPFRRLCVSLGAQATYSEMAMSLPLMQGSKSEWALMRAHASETAPPAHAGVVTGYDSSRDVKFGAQIAANKPWQAIKATEILTALCPHLRVVDLNCGCPIDLVFRSGAGSGLMDSPGKLEKMLRGMNTVSGEVPVTVKIRMGTRDGKPTAQKLIDRLLYGGQVAYESGQSPCGVAAITLHGRSRQQRYTRSADWEYIADCAAFIKQYQEQSNSQVDTAQEPDSQSKPDRVYFLGNGDCYSHIDYNDHLDNTGVDSVMVARGALIKPWIFEEIEKQQYLDKSASERLQYIEQYAKNGLEVWGSDERGVGLTRRFLLEWLSFAYRYVPVGLLEHLPPNIQDRPPAWTGRNELETLMGSGDYRDWVKLSEMFLGPAHKDFHFQPKHKSNSYEIEAEG